MSKRQQRSKAVNSKNAKGGKARRRDCFWCCTENDDLFYDQTTAQQHSSCWQGSIFTPMLRGGRGGDGGGGRGVCTVVSLGAHFKATLATHSRAGFQRLAAAATRFTRLHLNLASSAKPVPNLPSLDACVLARYLRLWDKATCDSLGQKK